MRFWMLALLVCRVLAGPLSAQAGADAAGALEEEQAGGLTTVELRVISAGPGPVVTVDRGGSDALEEGDLVLFHPRQGGVLSGTVATVNRRSALVELHDPAAIPPAGTRGEARIPRRRLNERAAARREGARAELETAPETPPTEPRPAEPAGEQGDSPWSNPDGEWSRGMPLLAEVGVVRPEQREARVTGRYYAIADQIITSDEGRKSGFYRLGTSVGYENLFGRGGELRFDGELNQRDVDVPDADDEQGGTLRIDRLSYRWGGTRFAPVRQEAGRFLQYGLPEFGLLDGYEWSRRTEQGGRYGISAGLMPEPDEDLESGNDFQLAAFYRWVSDESERLSASAGFQKTWHQGAADRDLLVGKIHYLPLEGWALHGTAWIDYYTSGDDAKGSGLGLTQAYVSAYRAFASGHGSAKDSLSVTYSHLEFPDIERNEFLPPLQEELADERRDRLELSGKRWVRSDQRLHGSLGVWADDGDDGFDGELGFEVVLPRSRADITAFGAHGAFSSALGLRGSYGYYVDNGRWDVSYEISNQDNQGFAEDNDDLVQQRLRAVREHHTRSGWNLSGYLELDYWEEEQALVLGFYLQRSF